MEQKVILELRDIKKTFNGIHALEAAHFELRHAEIHTLIGENGAGKSTLLNIASGSLGVDSGNIYLNGQEVHLKSPLIAQKLGIIKVHQELQLISEMKVFENVFLGNEIVYPKTKSLNVTKMIQETNSLLKRVGADFDGTHIIKELTVAQQQLVELAKALQKGFSVLILDEPTSSLTKKEIDKLFEIMRNLKNDGKSIIFVSHRMEEIFKISDRVTVYRDGRYINTLPIDQVDNRKLIKLMTGRDWNQYIKNDKAVKYDQIVLSVRDLTGTNGRFSNISFDLFKGEILGFAGLVGSGRTETMRAIFGADKLVSGEIFVDGKKVEIQSTKKATEVGLALIPEDRKAQGMIRGLSNMNNICLSSYNRLLKMGRLNNQAILKNALHFLEELNVKPLDPMLNTENLSGGNQQKIVIGKWLSTNSKILIMDEPTRGIDVGAKEEIHKLMLNLIDEGVSIIMISSELPEVLSMSNRILVMHEGKITGEVNAQEATEESVLYYAMGGS